MKRIGIFVDVSNIYYCVSKKFGEHAKLDYQKYLDNIKDLGDIQQAVAYGAHKDNSASSFIHCLTTAGFKVKYKTPKSYRVGQEVRYKADWDVGITVDVIKMLPKFDLVILGSADGDLEPLVQYILDQGGQVVIYACGISRQLKDTGITVIEITESLLQ